MRRIIVFTYGVTCYLIFLGTFLYAVGFVGNFLVPKSLDSAPTMPLANTVRHKFWLRRSGLSYSLSLRERARVRESNKEYDSFFPSS
jgi:hypothetical protein